MKECPEGLKPNALQGFMSELKLRPAKVAFMGWPPRIRRTA
jgi:hypothetical protein